MILTDIWQSFLTIVKEEAGSRVVETWFKVVTLAQWDAASKTVYLRAPNTFIKDWIIANYQPLFQKHLGRLLNEDSIALIFLDDSALHMTPQPSAEPGTGRSIADLVVPNSDVIAKKHAIVAKSNAERMRINQTYQFESFVVGPNSSLAYAAAYAVAEKPGVLYNPLFIYGQSGLGKTHLLHAIGNRIKTVNGRIKILYQSADRFVNEFINAIRFDKIQVFEHKYRDVDVLLMDDIQFISNKEQTQEAFFHIFNALYETRRQIVFSSDSMPRDIAGLADRLRSRLEGGLMTDIQIPTLETKVAILKKKADTHHEKLSDDVAHFIATQVVSNVRELEGLLIRVLAFSSLTQQPISLELAQRVLIRHDQDVSRQMILDLSHIANKVAKHFNYSIQELRSTKRHKKLTLARHVAMYFMKKLTDNSLSDIAAFWHRKDHSTVIHALEKISYCNEIDQTFGQELLRLEQVVCQ